MVLRSRAFLFFLLFLSLTLAPAAFGQRVLRGVVLEAENQTPLPAANVYIEGTLTGTITNTDGVYELQIPDDEVTVIFRYIGYESQRIVVPPGDIEPVDVNLSPVVYALEGITVTDEDPAARIMQLVIDRKKEWRGQLESFEAEAYNRFTLRNDTGIVSIIESLSDAFWDAEKGMREVVKSRRQTSNLEIDDVLPAAMFVANLYDDNIDIAGYTFRGVTHPDAVQHYYFSLIGYRQIDDRLVYDIKVEPRNRLKVGFSGQVSVLDEEFALLEVKLEPGEAFLFPTPIQAFDVIYEQQFSNFDTAFWLPVDFRARMGIEIGMGALLSLPRINIQQVSRLSEYDVNKALPDSLFEQDDQVMVDSVAVAADTLLDRSGVAVPLETMEAAAYQAIDSTMTLEKAFEPRGALSVMIETDSDEDGFSARNDRIDWLSIDPQLQFNRVEGLYIGVAPEIDLGDRGEVKPRLGFSQALHSKERLTFGLSAEIELDKDGIWTLDAGYLHGPRARFTDSNALLFMNTTNVLLAGVDAFDYYHTDGVEGGLQWEGRESDFRAGIRVHHAEHTSLSKNTDFDLLGESFIQRPNPAIDNGVLGSITFNLGWGFDRDNIVVGDAQALDLWLERSADGFLGSIHDYTHLRATGAWRFNTFFQRRIIPNTLDVKVVAGTLLNGELPRQRYGGIPSRVGFINPFGVIRSGDGYPLEGDDYVAFFWEHNFRTAPFELLGLRFLAQKAYNLIVFGAHAQTWAPTMEMNQQFPVPDLLPWPAGANRVHHEIGVSLSGVLSLFRIDTAIQLHEPGVRVGIGVASIF